MKRVFDILGALVGFVFVLPLTPFIILGILLESGFPVFMQLRRVSAGKIVGVYKFRTMIKGAEKMKLDLSHLNERSDGPFFKVKNDPRITRVGRFLRRTRLDEFPQLINVLRGELSLVGPRPHEPEEMLKYPPEFQKLFLFKGGVTGLSQIKSRPYLPFQKELNLDLFYIENQSFWLDVKILLKTFWIFLFEHNGI